MRDSAGGIIDPLSLTPILVNASSKQMDHIYELEMYKRLVPKVVDYIRRIMPADYDRRVATFLTNLVRISRFTLVMTSDSNQNKRKDLRVYFGIILDILCQDEFVYDEGIVGRVLERAVSPEPIRFMNESPAKARERASILCDPHASGCFSSFHIKTVKEIREYFIETGARLFHEACTSLELMRDDWIESRFAQLYAEWRACITQPHHHHKESALHTYMSLSAIYRR
jgi:hypothetical protein